MAEEYFRNISVGGKVLSSLTRAGKPMSEDVICPHLRAVLTIDRSMEGQGDMRGRNRNIFASETKGKETLD